MDMLILILNLFEVLTWLWLYFRLVNISHEINFPFWLLPYSQLQFYLFEHCANFDRFHIFSCGPSSQLQWQHYECNSTVKFLCFRTISRHRIDSYHGYHFIIFLVRFLGIPGLLNPRPKLYLLAKWECEW